MDEAESITGGGVADLLMDTAELIGDQRQNPALDLMVANTSAFCESQLISNRGKGAAILSLGLSLTLGAKLTGVSPSTIALGRQSLNDPSPVIENQPNPNNATDEERRSFEDFVFERAPVRSGSIKDRRLRSNSVRIFYDKEYVPHASESNSPVRSYNTIRNWLQEIGVKRGKFDRYRCETCFEGRMAEQRQREGKMREGDAALIASYTIHSDLVQQQFAAAKVDKLICDPSVLLCIFDYTTIHDLTSEKVLSIESFIFTLFNISLNPTQRPLVEGHGRLLHSRRREIFY